MHLFPITFALENLASIYCCGERRMDIYGEFTHTWFFQVEAMLLYNLFTYFFPFDIIESSVLGTVQVLCL